LIGSTSKFSNGCSGGVLIDRGLDQHLVLAFKDFIQSRLHQ
jgi:hypothetical protein